MMNLMFMAMLNNNGGSGNTSNSLPPTSPNQHPSET
jgi:hypothetical protein